MEVMGHHITLCRECPACDLRQMALRDLLIAQSHLLLKGLHLFFKD